MHDEEGISYKTGMCSSSVMKMVISVSPSLIFIFPICWRCVCVWGGCSAREQLSGSLKYQYCSLKSLMV